MCRYAHVWRPTKRAEKFPLPMGLIPLLNLAGSVSRRCRLQWMDGHAGRERLGHLDLPNGLAWLAVVGMPKPGSGMAFLHAARLSSPMLTERTVFPQVFLRDG